jgi:hypothetical protein
MYQQNGEKNEKLLILILLTNIGCASSSQRISKYYWKMAQNEILPRAEIDLNCKKVNMIFKAKQEAKSRHENTFLLYIPLLTFHSEGGDSATLVKAEGCGKSLLYARASTETLWEIYTPYQNTNKPND